jgi:hypothetical protein
MTVVAQQEHGGVVVRRAGRVSHHVLTQGDQGAVSIRGLQQVRPVGEQIEGASGRA